MGISYLMFTKLKNKEEFDVRNISDIFQQCQEKINALPYYQNHNLRKNGVMCLEIHFTGDIPAKSVSAWLSANIEWCKEYFIRSVIVLETHDINLEHPVQNIYVIPLSSRGAISCEDYCNGKLQLKNMHATYRLKINSKINITTAPLQSIYQASSGQDPFNNPLYPVINKDADIREYKQDMDKYINQLKMHYEGQIANLKGQTAKELITENTYLKKQNMQLEKYVTPYINFISKYGGLSKVEKMLHTSQQVQYAVKLYQEDGDKESLQDIQKILDDGMKYCSRHNISL